MTDSNTALGDEPSTAAPPLYHVVYCSRASQGVGDADVARIVATARQHNAIHGITGLLVFGSGIFFQWLEGPRVSVQRLMTLLRADPRHRDVVSLVESEEVRDRLFPDWDMELVTTEHIQDVLTDALGSATDARSVLVLQQLLQHLGAEPLADLASRGSLG
jgi:hypothetical protein